MLTDQSADSILHEVLFLCLLSSLICLPVYMLQEAPDDKLVIKSDVLRKYFPKSYTPQQMEAVIMKLLEQWMKKRSREQER